MDATNRDIAWLMDLAGKFPEAEENYRKALMQDPGDRDSLMNFARLLIRQGRSHELNDSIAPYMSRHGSDAELKALLEPARAAQPRSGGVEMRMQRLEGVSSESWKHAPREIGSYEEVAHLVDAVPGWLLQGQEKYLFDKVKALPDNSLIMEIGCDQGRSTTAMAFACIGTGKRIYSIDSFCGNDGIMARTEDFMETWRANLAKNGLDGYVTPVKGFSFDVLRNWTGPLQFDFIFLDASHEYVDVMMDFQLVYPLLRVGGWLAFHDVEPGWPGPWRTWLEYGSTLLTDHEIVATLACGRKSKPGEFKHLDKRHSEFSFAWHYKEHLSGLFKSAAAPLINAMEVSLDGRYGTPAERDAMHSAELMLGTMPEEVPFRKTLRSMMSKDAKLDGHLQLWHAMVLMAETKWEDAYRALIMATKVSRPVPVERIVAYCQVLREKIGSGKQLPQPGAPTFGFLSGDQTTDTKVGHYGREYFNWQKTVGAFGGVANLFKFQEWVKPTDTVVDLGCGGGYLLGNLNCARRMGVELNPVARRDASLHSGIDTVEGVDDLPDEYADVVVSNHAMEHMFSPFDVLTSLLPKVKIGGKLVLVVPNDPPQQDWDPKDHNKHLFTWNPMNLGNLLSVAGYKVLRVDALRHQWPPNFVQVFEQHGEENFHKACREQALSTGNHQMRVIAVREAPPPEEPSHRFSVGRHALPSASEIPVALMTYRRPEHTQKVLKALETLGAKNLYIFSDGAKSDADKADVERTRKLCRSVPWAKLRYEESRENRGLARSILSAADQLMERSEFFILLEDDCVPQQYFMDFMARCLDKYRDNPKVYGVSGYSMPLSRDILRDYSRDAYFYPRIGSWGWGTWRRAWSHLDRDLARIHRTILEKGIDLDQGGEDVRPMVEGMLRNEVKDVWTLNWMLSVYAKGGVYAYPRESHIQNIGFDGTGVHGGATDRYETTYAQRPPRDLPDEISVDPAIARHFRSFVSIR